MDDLLVFDVFSDTENASFGIISNSRTVFGSVVKSVRDQGEELFGSCDGTYRTHKDQWALVNFGTYTTQYSCGSFAKHFVPWIFMFVKSESEVA
eukprot:jgi/Phyca11/123325/e_gw1.50.463.1